MFEHNMHFKYIIFSIDSVNVCLVYQFMAGIVMQLLKTQLGFVSNYISLSLALCTMQLGDLAHLPTQLGNVNLARRKRKCKRESKPKHSKD